MAKHKSFTVDTKVQVYFCDPQSPWQRGTNENTNGLLRQYFQKKTDLSGYSQIYLDKVALRLNQPPRKTLGFETPADKLQASVASTIETAPFSRNSSETPRHSKLHYFRIGDHPPGTHKTILNLSWKRASGCSRQAKLMTRKIGEHEPVGSRTGAAFRKGHDFAAVFRELRFDWRRSTCPCATSRPCNKRGSTTSETRWLNPSWDEISQVSNPIKTALCRACRVLRMRLPSHTPPGGYAPLAACWRLVRRR